MFSNYGHQGGAPWCLPRTYLTPKLKQDRSNLLLQSYARYSSNNLEILVESFFKKLQFVLVIGLTLFLPDVVTWRSYMGWFRPWPVGTGLTKLGSADYFHLLQLAPPNFFTFRHHCININTMDQKRGRNVRLKANGIFRGRQQTRMARRWLVYIPALDIAWSTKLHCTFLINTRRLIGSTDQADPSCFYFRISWILMEQSWFYFLCPLGLLQGRVTRVGSDTFGDPSFQKGLQN